MQTKQAKRKTAIRIYEQALDHWNREVLRTAKGTEELVSKAARKIQNLRFSIERTKARLSY